MHTDADVSHLQVVESMRRGMPPTEACETAVRRILHHYPSYVGAVVALDKHGHHGAAAHGWKFSYSIRSTQMRDVEVIDVIPLRQILRQK